MAKSVRFTDLVTFGRKLVQELDLDQSVDTAGRWMAHYITELIARAQTCEGTEKAAVERECFEVVLQLWRHRAALPSRQRPLESFEPIFQALNQLTQGTTVYFSRTEKKLDAKSEKWLELATGLDHSARELIYWCITNAAAVAAKKEEAWLQDETAQALDNGPDMQVARMLARNVRVIFSKQDLDEEQSDELVKIRERLAAFVSLSKTMQDEIEHAFTRK